MHYKEPFCDIRQLKPHLVKGGTNKYIKPVKSSWKFLPTQDSVPHRQIEKRQHMLKANKINNKSQTVDSPKHSKSHNISPCYS